MPEENDQEVHPMMDQKVIGSKGYKSLDTTDKPNFTEQADYLISHGYFVDNQIISVTDLAEQLEKISDEINKKPIE